jgi:hypothetical protein
VAKHRSADWQLDLKPVALAQLTTTSLQSTENGAAHRAERATDNTAVLNTLTAVTAAVTELSRAVAAIGQRLDGLERAAAEQAATSNSLANQLLTSAATATTSAAAPPEASTGTSRAVRPTTRALRDSTTAPLARRTRRAAPPAQPDADGTPAE